MFISVIVLFISAGCAGVDSNQQMKSSATQEWLFDGGYSLTVPAEWPDVNVLSAEVSRLSTYIIEVVGYDSRYSGATDAPESFLLILYMSDLKTQEVMAFGLVHYQEAENKLTYYLVQDKAVVLTTQKEFETRLEALFNWDSAR